MKNVLFVCIHNSARSQMTEAFLNDSGKHHFNAESAGIESGKLNPVVVEVMKEVGIDISNNKTKTVDDILAQGKSYDFVVTVCDTEAAERCPVFPGKGIRLHWSFEDPSAYQGGDEEKLIKTRIVRDEIKAAIHQFIADVNDGKYNIA